MPRRSRAAGDGSVKEMKLVAVGLMLILPFLGGAAALDCGSPKREKVQEWLAQHIQQGKLLLRAEAKHAIIISSEKDWDWVEVLITAHSGQVVGNVQASDFLDPDGKIYIKFSLWVGGEKRALISTGIKEQWVANLPSLWLVGYPKYQEIHGEQFHVFESNSCWAMSIEGAMRNSPDVISDLNWQNITK